MCHCGDCSRYARHLGRADATEVVQTAPSLVRITSGIEHVRCLRLSPKGLTRWFAACCKTPLANTTGRARVPFVGLMVATLDTKDESLLGKKRDVSGGRRTPLSVVFRALAFLVASFVRRRHRPSPFFDERGAMVAQPEIVSAGVS